MYNKPLTRSKREICFPLDITLLDCVRYGKKKNRARIDILEKLPSTLYGFSRHILNSATIDRE